MPERTVWIARHGNRLDFDDSGWSRTAARPFDPPLSATGRRQARALATRVARTSPLQLFSSPFLRCIETAVPLAERAGTGIRIEAGLSEWLNDAWYGEPPALIPVARLAQRFPRVDLAYRSRGAARYGEGGPEALERAGETALRLVAEFGGNLAMVGHGASVLGALAALLAEDPEQIPDLGYGCAAELAGRAGGRWIRVDRAAVDGNAR